MTRQLNESYARRSLYFYLNHAGSADADKQLKEMNNFLVNKCPKDDLEHIITEYNGNTYYHISHSDVSNWFVFWGRESRIDWVEGEGFTITEVSKKLRWWGIWLSIKSKLFPTYNGF